MTIVIHGIRSLLYFNMMWDTLYFRNAMKMRTAGGKTEK